MCKKLFCFLILLLSLTASFALQAKDKDWGPFDRLRVMQKFLDAVYPDLKNSRGLLILRTEEFHAATGAMDEIDAIQCHPGSGVPGGSVPGQPPAASMQHCAGLYPPDPSYFLTVQVWFSTKYPIRSYSAGGSFTEMRSKSVRKEIIDHPEWNEQQRIEALRQANPRFGPDHKKEFLSTVPVEAIRKFTGCYLQSETAALYAWRSDDVPPDPPVAAIAWRISGKSHNASRHHDACSAAFEPFEGRLISVMDLP